MISPARQAAYDVTLAVERGRADLASALVDLRDRLADERDRALATDIAVGTQRWRARLDHVIAQAAGRALDRLDVEVLAILRLSVHQLLHLTRVPASAVVNDAVNLVKKARKRSAAGFVNAVLRRVVAAPAPLPAAPDAAPDTAEWRQQALVFLSVTESHPAWLVERWLDRYGWDATAAWVAYNNTAAPVTVWPAPGRPSLATGDWPPHEPTVWVPGGARLEAGHDAVALLRDGRVYAQDEASAAVGAVAAAVAESPALDACGSPGGKSLVLAEALASDRLLVSADLRPRRVTTLRATLGRLAARPVPVARLDATHLPFRASLGMVLIDAPCSGLGTLRRDPDLRWRRRADDLAGFADTQRAMIGEAMRAVRPGGRVVYATCSSEPDENEALVAEVLRDTDWRLAPLHGVALPGRLHDTIAPEGWLRTLPHRHGLDAFFVAVLEPPSAAGG